MKNIYSEKEVSYFEHSRPELLEFLPKKISRALDIGCANGKFGAMLKSIYNCEVWGVEADNRAAMQSERKLDKVIYGPFNSEIDLSKDQQFDCIFFNDVLEHMEQPENALSLASSYLKPNGCVVASIPNIRYYPVLLSLLRYKDFQYADAGVLDRTHLRFFTAKSMIRLFEEAGFTIERIEGINRGFFRYFEILNFFCLGKLKDMRYPQFAIVAKIK